MGKEEDDKDRRREKAERRQRRRRDGNVSLAFTSQNLGLLLERALKDAYDAKAGR